MGKAWTADADNARVRCVECEYLGPLCRFTCVIRLVPTMLTVVSADADDVRVYWVRCKRPCRLMLIMLTGTV